MDKMQKLDFKQKLTLVLVSPLLFLALFYIAIQFFEWQLEAGLKKFAEIIEPMGRLSFKEIQLHPFDQQFTIENLEFRWVNDPETYEVNLIRVQGWHWKELLWMNAADLFIPSRLRFDVLGLRLPFFKDKNTTEFFKEMRLSGAHFDFHFSYDLEKNTGDFKLNDLSLVAPQLLKARLKVEMTGVFLPFLGRNELKTNSELREELLLTGKPIRLKSLHFEMIDHSLAQRIRYATYKVFDLDLVKPLETYSKWRYLPFVGEQGMARRLQEVFQKPSELHFRVEPLQPVSFLEVFTFKNLMSPKENFGISLKINDSELF